MPTLRVLSLATLALILVAAGWQLMHHNRKSSPEVLPGIPRLELICDPGTNSCSLRPVKHWLERMAGEQRRAREEQQAVLEQAEHKRFKFLNIQLGVSAIFVVACLWVVLSTKYPQDTKSWAFSALTMIAGLWLGTAVWH